MLVLFSIILTTIVLTISPLHSTFAAPADLNVDVATGQSSNVMHLQRDRWQPDDSTCTADETWDSRVCRPPIGDRVWEDRCRGSPTGAIVSYRMRLCPVNTICGNVIREGTRDLTIVCNPRPVQEVVSKTGEQSGVKQFGGLSNPEVEYIQSVTLTNDIMLASVWALLEGSDGGYLVTPTNAIVGSLRGTTVKPCEYNATNQDCVPTNLFILKKGDIIDFTFGITPGQIVRLYYGIFGNGDN